MDIKETLEVLALAKKAAVQTKEILKDGKVDIFDLPKLAPLFGAAKAALEGAQNIASELSDLDAEEVSTLLNEAVAVAAAWADVFVKP